MDLDTILEAPLGVCTKGLPDDLAKVPLGRIGDLGLSLWADDLLLPALTLRGDRLRHNLARMMRFCREHGVALAPHGKTTMAPQLFADQLAAGAWGITAATVGQAQVMARFGVPRILIANEVVDRRAIRWLADTELEVCCLVDSVAGVEALGAAGAPVRVLVEVGIPGRRSGLRDESAALGVLEAAARARWVEPVGVECFEGVVTDAAAVDEALDRVAELALAGAERGLFAAARALVTAGGSVFFDAAARLAGTPGADVVLRSGCYVTHDNGMYEAASPLARSQGATDPLLPALELWADVLSCPEPGRAIACAGRRDAPYDAGLPAVLRAYRRGERLPLAGATVTELMDQHAFVSFEPAGALRPGDLLCLGISHPCGAFDRWRTLLEVDEDYTVTRAIRTFF